jgi:2-aminoadipate transaminase
VTSISFARGIPAPECLPVEELADCAKAALERDGRTILSYGSTLGYEPLREWIADRHGVAAERVVITNGSLQGFHFLLDHFAGRGSVIAERPTYDRPRKILASLAEVPLDADGLDVEALERLLDGGGRYAFLYTIPTFQNPAGVTLSLERRRRLATLVAERSLPTLEDDPYGLVRYDGESLPTLFELEGGTQVMYSSSFSKTVAPGVRVGYLVLPPELARALVEEVASTYITPALLSQATVHEFARRGLFEPNLERVSGLLRARRDAMLEALDDHFTGIATWNRPEGGYFLWLELPEDVDAGELLGRAEQAGVTFVKGADFGGAPNTARLAFSFVSPDEIRLGVERLASSLLPAAAPAH